MRVKEIKINNFKCLGPVPVSISWDDIIILVGENNTGKSSVLQALNIFFSNKKTVEARLFRGMDKNVGEEGIKPIEITIAFTDLTNKDKQQRGIRHHLNSEGDWILRKVFRYKIGEKSDPVEYFTLEEEKEIKGLKKSSMWDEVRKKFPKSEVARGKKGTSTVGSDDFFQLIDEAIEKWPKEINSIGKYEWVRNPGGWQSNIDSIFANHFKLTFVRAVHEAEDEISGGVNSAFYQLFALLVGQAISKSKPIKKLEDSLSEVLALYTKDKSGKHCIPAVGKLEDELSRKIGRIITAKTIIQAVPPKEEKISQQILPVPSLEIDDGYKTIISEQGHGLQRALILALLETLADYETKDAFNIGPKNILMIEEPELYMHPQMERKMKNALYAIAGSKRFQVICSTHSPVFLDMAEKQESIVRLEKDSHRNIDVKQVDKNIFSGSTYQDEKAKLRMILFFDPTVNELFFAKRVVLVEGDSEVAIFPRAAELLGVDKRIIQDTTFINCRGKRTMPAFIRVLNHFKIKFSVVHDKDNGGEKFNQKIEELANKEGLGKVKQLQNKLEEIIGIEDKGKDKLIRAFKQVETLAKQGKLKQIFGQYIRFVFQIKN